MVLNSFATPPQRSISVATRAPRLRRWTCPGTNCVNELAMAMIGLSKSPSFIPVARQRLRAPAILRPCVVVRERYVGTSLYDTNVGGNGSPGREKARIPAHVN